MGYFSDAAIVETKELDNWVKRMMKSPAYRNSRKTEKGFNKELEGIVKLAALHVQGAIRSAAPEKTGTLKNGIILHKERKRYSGKIVYDVYIDPAKNAVFQKPIKHPVRSKSPYAYYPASQEYGFFSRRADGGMVYTRPTGEKIRMSHVPGKHYMRTGVEVAGEKAKDEILGSALSAVEKAFGG